MVGFAAVQRVSRAFSAAGVGPRLQPAEIAYRRPLVAAGLIAVMLLAVGLRLVPTARDLRFAWEETAQQRLDDQAQKVRESLRAALLEWARKAGNFRNDASP